MVSYLMSQHPQLEGLFAGGTSPGKIVNGHSHGFCESGHIWHFLFDAEAAISMSQGLRPIWGHPKYISHYYRDAPKTRKEALLLVNAIQRFRKTDKVPLIKDQMNILRIGLVKAIFSKAKFLIVIRDYPDYIKSCHHKWLNSKWFSSQQNIKPSIGIHWLTLNNLALFELESFAPEDHAVIFYRDLYNEKRLEKALRSALLKLNLAPFEFNFAAIGSQYRYINSEVQREDVDFDIPFEIAKNEKLMLQVD